MLRSKRWAAAAIAALLVFTLSGAVQAGAPYSAENAPGMNKPRQEVYAALYRSGVRDLTADHWAAGSLTEMMARHLMVPDGAGRIYPEAALLDQDSIRIFVKALGIADLYDDTETALAKAQAAGLLPSEGEALDTMARIELARLAAKALGIAPRLYIDNANYPFNDYYAVSQADAALVAGLYDAGLFQGYPERLFRPEEPLTRAELAAVIDRVLGALPAHAAAE